MIEDEQREIREAAAELRELRGATPIPPNRSQTIDWSTGEAAVYSDNVVPFKRAAKLGAVLACLAAFAFVAGVAFPQAATATLRTAAMIAPAGIVVDVVLGAVAAFIAIRKWRSK